LTLSNFYQFGKPKGPLVGQQFDSPEELLLANKEVTDSIRRAELESVFDAWKRRFGERIQMKGEFITQGKSKSFREIQCSHPQTEMQ
jgi:hypothetical protein